MNRSIHYQRIHRFVRTVWTMLHDKLVLMPLICIIVLSTITITAKHSPYQSVTTRLYENSNNTNITQNNDHTITNHTSQLTPQSTIPITHAPVISTHQSQCADRYPIRHNYTNPHKYLIAILLHNSQQLVPDTLVELTRTIQLLGVSNVYLSLYESGSNDLTTNWLRLYENILISMNVGHRFVLNGNVSRHDYPYDRIGYLAILRNLALQPMFDPTVMKFDRIIFLNDIIFCSEDIIQLIQTHTIGDNSLTCGLDIEDSEFYDTWVCYVYLLQIALLFHQTNNTLYFR